MEDKQVSESWERGNPYEQHIGRWSRRVAPLFVSWLRIPVGRKWLDVGCGTGALCAAILDYASPSSVIGIDPSEGFLNIARENLGGRAVLYRGSATEIPIDDASVHVVVSALVLNFLTDPQGALAEMVRVTDSGGTIGAYVWDYAEKMELIRFFWDAAVELDPPAARIAECIGFHLCRPEALERLFVGAGLKEVEVKPIDIPTLFANFDDYWLPFLGGQGPAPAYAMSLNETARARLRDRIRERIPIAADGTISMTARAWAIRATVAKLRIPDSEHQRARR